MSVEILSTEWQREIDSTVEQDPMRVSFLDGGKETKQKAITPSLAVRMTEGRDTYPGNVILFS